MAVDDGVAGGSAQRAYERKAARDAERRADRRTVKLVILVVLPVAVFLAVRFGGPPVLQLLADRLTESAGGTSSAEPPAEGGAFALPALVAAGVSALSLWRSMFGRRQTTEAWGKGAVGERATGATLAKLPDTFTVLHDLRIPGSRANIDHVVVGPTGVVTVETKNYSHPVTIRGGSARSGRTPLAKVVDQALRQASVVSSHLGGHPVTPLVAIQGTSIDVGWFGKPVVGGVRFTSNRRLVEVITRRPTILDPAQVQQIVDEVRTRLR